MADEHEPYETFDVERPPRDPFVDALNVARAFVLRVPSSDTYVRADQIHSALAWRIGFRASDLELQSQIDTSVSNFLYKRLVRDICSINRLHKTLSKPFFFEAEKFAWNLRSHLLELLIHDILNEQEHLAAMAPFDEDLINRTDILYLPPALYPAPPTRLQVSWASSSYALGRKFKTVRFRKEFVFICPYSLALVIHGEGPRALLQSLEPETRELAELKASSDQLTAVKIRDILDAALTRQSGHPLGPLFNIPVSLRTFIRKYALVFAHRSFEANEKRTKRLWRTEDSLSDSAKEDSGAELVDEKSEGTDS